MSSVEGRGAATRAGIAIGANLGDAEKSVHDAIDWLRTGNFDIRLVAASSLHRTAPWGLLDQPDFTNAVAIVETELAPRELLNRLLAREAAVGRVRREKWGPRVLDLDLLWHGAAILDEPGLSLPHPRLAVRAFVLAPLAEIAPDWHHPVTGMAAREMLQALEAAR